MEFEWDEDKAKKNITNHGVRFEKAIRVFDDPNVLVISDPYEKEERWDAIGFVDSVLFVVYTERVNEKIRIISARKATKGEINGYKNHDFGRS